MPKFDLTIIASGLDTEHGSFEDLLFEAGCDDATITLQKGVIILEFCRDARNFIHALVSAMRDVEKAGARVERIEPDHLVSLTDISRRTGLSKAAISLYANQARGKDFPTPVARVTTESPLWDWCEVTQWLHANNRIDLETVLKARTVRDANFAVSSKMIALSHLEMHLEVRTEEYQLEVV